MQSDMFAEVREYYEEPTELDDAADYQIREKWRLIIQWFKEQSDFKDSACISIGDVGEFWELSEDDYPAGTVMTPSVLPRMILGLTQSGSLCGLFGYTVQT